MSRPSVNGQSGQAPHISVSDADRRAHAGSPHRTAWANRIVAAIIAAGLIALLVTARTLQPNPDGLGTHRQLGLPPCSMLWATGVRCPGCGMTTSWAHITRGQLPSAVSVNLAGSLLAVLAAIVAAASARVAITAATVTRRQQWILTIALLVIVAVAMLDWMRRVLATWG